MAFATVAPQSLLVDIVTPMAVDARRLCHGLHGLRGLRGPPGMADIAYNSLMCASQRKFRLPCVVEAGLLPRRSGVTRAAVVAESARVNVVLCMAPGAALGQLPLARRLAMAAHAAHRGMGPRQRELTLLLVVKVLLHPARGLVALRTVRPESPGVRIVDGVTGQAVGRGSLVALPSMAASTAHLDVRPGQGILGVVVIEAGRVPIERLVAVAALRGERAIVRVILLPMTIHAVHGRLAPLLALPMTFRAGRRRVAPDQGEVRLRVIESRLTHPHDVRLSSEMVGMAAPTLPGRGEGASSMESNVAREVVGDLLVASEAERALRIAFECLVARRTVFLELCMPRDQQAGHHHALPVDGRSACGPSQPDEHREQKSSASRLEARNTRPHQ